MFKAALTPQVLFDFIFAKKKENAAALEKCRFRLDLYPAMCYNKVKWIIEDFGKEPCICIELYANGC